MKPLTCAATRRRLHAFHDHELGVADQIAVAQHLEWCDDCGSALADLRAVRVAIHALAPGRGAVSAYDAGAFGAAVVNRLKAENAASFAVRLRGMFDDMHLVYAGLGAAVATIVCVFVMAGMMRFATSERPDSLAAIVSMLATPLECEFGNELADAAACRERWVERFQRANEAAEQDAVFTLEAVLTHQGRLANLAVLRAGGHHSAAGQVKLIEGLLDAVNRSRLGGGQTPQPPSSINNMLWLVERETVRASKQPPLDVPLPKKRAAAHGESFHPIAI